MTFKMGWWFAKEYNPLQVGSIDGTDTIPHDHGIRRAIQAQQVARSDEDTFAVTPTDEKTASHTPTATNDTADPYKTIFVGKLDPITTTATLRSAFEAFGPLKDVKLVRCIVTGESKRYAFIEYMYERGCDNAYEVGCWGRVYGCISAFRMMVPECGNDDLSPLVHEDNFMYSLL